MKIQIISDVHTEFHRDCGVEFAQTIADDHRDTLVIAGDLGSLTTLTYCVPIFRQHFKHVIYVAGNHEYYGATFDDVNKTLSEFNEKFANFHWLNNDVVVLDGQRFLGTTLWYEKSTEALANKKYIADASHIRDWHRAFDEHEIARDFLQKNVCEGDIVVTHHLPTEQSISQQYKGNAINCYFLSAMDHVMNSAHPKIWIHGHTHDSKDFIHDPSGTRIVCNPFGYAGQKLNSEFIDYKTIEV